MRRNIASAGRPLTNAPDSATIGLVNELTTKTSIVDTKVELPLCMECSVTPVSRKSAKFCSNACRQTAYRKSPAHTKALKRLANARTLRRATWEHRRHRDKAMGVFRGYGGPEVSGVPRLGMLDLRNFKEAK